LQFHCSSVYEYPACLAIDFDSYHRATSEADAVSKMSVKASSRLAHASSMEEPWLAISHLGKKQHSHRLRVQ
jgi:hypothetical protein